MVQHQDNNYTNASYDTYALTMVGAEKEKSQAGRLALSIGAQSDPGIRRKQRPNEDTNS